MMRPSSKAGYRRHLNDHLGSPGPKKSQSHFENVPKEHDEGGYYTNKKEDKEIEEDHYIDMEVDECEEPEYTSSRKGKGGKGGNYYGEELDEWPQQQPKSNKVHSYNRYLQSHDEQRHLRDDLPRVHGASRRNHRISDIHAAVEAELQTSKEQDVTGLRGLDQ